VPIRGLLSLNANRPGWHGSQRHPALLAGLQTPGTCFRAIPPLDQARVTTIKSGSMVITGVEEIAVGRNHVRHGGAVSSPAQHHAHQEAQLASHPDTQSIEDQDECELALS